jgi:hypothetical protein
MGRRNYSHGGRETFPHPLKICFSPLHGDLALDGMISGTLSAKTSV